MEHNEAAETTERNNLRIRCMDGDHLFEAEGVESMVTHLLGEWQRRVDEKQRNSRLLRDAGPGFAAEQPDDLRM